MDRNRRLKVFTKGFLGLVALALTLVLAACSAVQAAAPAASPTPGATPVIGVDPPTKAAPLATTALYEWRGTVIGLSGADLALKRSCDVWQLAPVSDTIDAKLRSLVGQEVIVWGKVAAASGTRKQAIAVQSAFGGKDPMPMTLMAVPSYPCPADPVPPVPPKPTPAAGLRPGEIEAIGTLVWEDWHPYLETPSGRIDLLVQQALRVTAAAGGAEATLSPDAFPTAARLQVLAVGTWQVSGGRLQITVRTLQAVSVLPPLPTPVPADRQGYVTGKVTVGPLCPVEPCPNGRTDVYSSRVLILTGKNSAVKVQLQADGWFKQAVPADTYTVTLSDCTFMGCRYALPKTVTVSSGQVTTFNIDIDTGIR